MAKRIELTSVPSDLPPEEVVRRFTAATKILMRGYYRMKAAEQLAAEATTAAEEASLTTRSEDGAVAHPPSPEKPQPKKRTKPHADSAIW